MLNHIPQPKPLQRAQTNGPECDVNSMLLDSRDELAKVLDLLELIRGASAPNASTDAAAINTGASIATEILTEACAVIAKAQAALFGEPQR